MKKSSLTQKFIAPSLVATSFVVAASVPLSTVNAMTASTTTNAQASTQTSLTGSLDQIKQTLTSAIETNISKLTQSQTALNATFSANPTSVTGATSGPAGSINYTVNKDSANGQITTPHGTVSYNFSKGDASGQASGSDGNSASGSLSNGMTSALSLGQGLFTDLLSIPQKLLTKLQSVNQKAVEKLTTLKSKVEAATQAGDIQAAVQQYNQSAQDFAVANVQANVTKALDSQAKVLDLLQAAANNLQTQVSKIQDCISSGSASGTANGTAGNGSATGSASGSVSAPSCNDFNVNLNSGDAAASLQQKLDQIKANIQTIRSFLSSSINLVSSLNANSSGTVTSFQGISSQLDIVANLSSNIQNDLLNLSASINK